MTSHLIVSELDDSTQIQSDLFILAAGFEDRAIHLLRSRSFNSDAHCLLIRYVNDVPGNKETFEKYLGLAREKFEERHIHVVALNTEEVRNFSANFDTLVNSIPSELANISLDVSGMTSYVICLCLKSLRERYPFRRQLIFYTSAETYNPSREEYEDLCRRQGEEIDYLPKSMALEMSDNLVLEEFAGHRSGDGRACLALFAGYEVHRSAGTIEETNPSLLLLLYGKPGDADLSWRLELSRSLHAKFEKGRRCATEIISTLQVQESVDILEEYYDKLIDDHDLIISPVCSKMHCVAAYLFWERYGEVQLTFPLPIGYDPAHRPVGIGRSYFVELYEQRRLFDQTGTDTLTQPN